MQHCVAGRLQLIFVAHVSSGDSNYTFHWVALLFVCKLSSIRGEKKNALEKWENVWIGNKSSDYSVDNMTVLQYIVHPMSLQGEWWPDWIRTSLIVKFNPGIQDNILSEAYASLLFDFSDSVVQNFSTWYGCKEE